MDTFTRGEMQRLLEREGRHCVSLFLPTQRGGSEQAPIRWKNLLRQAEEQLIAGGLRAPQARELLEPAWQVRENATFRQNPGDGLAAFLTHDFLRTYTVPQTLAELAVVSNRFHLKPLLPLLNGERYRVLALSQKAVRLLEGDSTGLHEVPVKGIPHSLAESLRFHDTDPQPLLFHTRPGPGGRGRWASVFHGRGMGFEDSKEDLLRYFQQIDRGLQELLREERSPLVLASVDYLWPIYRAANHYAHLMEVGIAGNPDQLSLTELHQRAQAVVAPHFAEAREREAARFVQLAGTGRTVGEMDEVVRAAWAGRLATLFVAGDREVWGTFDPVADRVEVYPIQRPQTQDLLDLAAVQTLRHGGTVHVVAGKDVPGGKGVAGLYRAEGGQR